MCIVIPGGHTFSQWLVLTLLEKCPKWNYSKGEALSIPLVVYYYKEVLHFFLVKKCKQFLNQNAKNSTQASSFITRELCEVVSIGYSAPCAL